MAAKLAALKTKYTVLKARYDTQVPSEQVNVEIRQAAAPDLVTDATSMSDELAPSIITEQNAKGTEERVLEAPFPGSIVGPSTIVLAVASVIGLALLILLVVAQEARSWIEKKGEVKRLLGERDSETLANEHYQWPHTYRHRHSEKREKRYRSERRPRPLQTSRRITRPSSV